MKFSSPSCYFGAVLRPSRSRCFVGSENASTFGTCPPRFQNTHVPESSIILQFLRRRKIEGCISSQSLDSELIRRGIGILRSTFPSPLSSQISFADSCVSSVRRQRGELVQNTRPSRRCSENPWSQRERKKGDIPCIELFGRRSLLIILSPPDVRTFAQTVTINSPYIPRVEGSTCYLS